jgi:hypothetical protein
MKKKVPRTKAQDALKEATNALSDALDDLRARNTLLVELVLDLRAALLAPEPLDQELLVHKIDAALKEVGI